MVVVRIGGHPDQIEETRKKTRALHLNLLLKGAALKVAQSLRCC